MPGRRPSQQAPDVADFLCSLLMKHSHLPPAAAGLPQTLYVRPWVPRAPSRPCFTAAKSPHGLTAAAPQRRWGRTGQVLGPPRDSSSGTARAQDPHPEAGAGAAAGTCWAWAQPRVATAPRPSGPHRITQRRPSHMLPLAPHPWRVQDLAHFWPEMPWAPPETRVCDVFLSQCPESTEDELRGVRVSLSIPFSHQRSILGRNTEHVKP